MNTDTLNLINQLNKDPMFNYKVTEVNNEYQVTIYWYEEGWGLFDKIINVRDYTELNGLLQRLLDKLNAR